METFITTLEQFDWNIWGYHLPVSSELTSKLSSESHRRVICTVNDQVKLHSALMLIDEGSYILINKSTRKKLGLALGDQVKVTLEKDTSEYGMPMPESLQVLLDQDEEGSRHFHALTPGKQRSLIYIVSKVKSVDKQINKGLAILEHLNEFRGQLDFKQLNEKIKSYNQRDKLW